jgi:hypothetical protein
MRVVAVVSFLLVCSVLAPSIAFAAPSGEPASQSAAIAPEHPNARSGVDGAASTVQSANESNTSLGLELSSFVQSTAAETDGVVANEMWEANVNRTGRPAAVTRRVDQLDQRVTTLREERQQLTRAYEDGDISTLRYRARLARLNGQLNALSAAAGSTERAANRLDTDASGLAEVRTEIERSKAETPPLGRSPGVSGADRDRGDRPERGGADAERGREADAGGPSAAGSDTAPGLDETGNGNGDASETRANATNRTQGETNETAAAAAERTGGAAGKTLGAGEETSSSRVAASASANATTDGAAADGRER